MLMGYTMTTAIFPALKQHEEHQAPKAESAVVSVEDDEGTEANVASSIALALVRIVFPSYFASERGTVSARDSRGQITLYVNAIQATQFRTHSFSFFINKTQCRLIHWSHSCAIVTDEFNYTEPDWLPNFFWRHSLSAFSCNNPEDP